MTEDVRPAAWVTPGHPVHAGAGYDCSCGQCLAQRSWVDNGFSIEQMSEWIDAGYVAPAAAIEWTAIGIDAPAVAQEWLSAGFTPESALPWVVVEDMTPSEAATCAKGGLTPADVKRIRRADPGWPRAEPPVPRRELGNADDGLCIDV